MCKFAVLITLEMGYVYLWNWLKYYPKLMYILYVYPIINALFVHSRGSIWDIVVHTPGLKYRTIKIF